MVTKIWLTNKNKSIFSNLPIGIMEEIINPIAILKKLKFEVIRDQINVRKIIVKKNFMKRVMFIIWNKLGLPIETQQQWMGHL